MSDYPKRDKKLFVAGKNPREHAYIGWGDAEIQFYGYALGYKEAADTIIAHALEQGDPATLDSMVFPACFLYRQYLELALKGIYLTYAGETNEEKVNAIKKCGHNLEEIWSKVKDLILTAYPNEDKEVLEAAELYILEFNSEDKTSYTFRYPVDKNLGLIHENKNYKIGKFEKDGWFICLKNLAKRMDELCTFLCSVSAGMSEMRGHESCMSQHFDSV